MEILLERKSNYWDFYKTLTIQNGSKEYSLKSGQSLEIEVNDIKQPLVIKSGQLQAQISAANLLEGKHYQIQSRIPNAFFIFLMALVAVLGMWTLIAPNNEMMQINALIITVSAMAQLLVYFLYRRRFYKIKPKS